MTKESPRLIYDKGFECGGEPGVVNRRVGAVQDVEEKRLEHLRDFVHALKIEGLEAGEREVVLGVVEESSVLAALHPFLERRSEIAAQDVRQRKEPALGRFDCVQA